MTDETRAWPTAAEEMAFRAGQALRAATERASLEARVRELEEALWFYANEENYKRTRAVAGWYEPRMDRGRRARKALSSQGEQVTSLSATEAQSEGSSNA